MPCGADRICVSETAGYESLAIRDGVLSLTSTRSDILLRVPPLPQPEVSINLVEAPVFRDREITERISIPPLASSILPMSVVTVFG